jgi:uncharacterized protein YeeX (DUF496 family)
MTEKKANEKFSQIILEFKMDLLNTFPELEDALKISDDEIFAHCSEVYPKIFFELLYENMTLFKEPNFLLPNIDFTILMNENVTEKTKKTIWKYLQLLLFSVVEQVDNKESFGDTSKLFEAIKEEDLHKKIMESMDEMKNLFSTDFSSNMGDISGDFMDGEKIKSHLDGLMNGKIGSLAKEIASEASKELGDIENPEEFMSSLMKNPKKIMDLVKNIGGKLEDKIKKGDLKESELLEEAKEIMEKMKDMPGMKEMMSKMGMGGKMDFKGMANKLQESLKMSKTKERLNKKREERAKTKTAIPDDVKVTQTAEDTFVVNVDGTKPKKSKGKKKKKHIKI